MALKSFEEDLDGYVMFSGRTGGTASHEIGIKVYVKLDRPLNDQDRRLSYKIMDLIHDGLMEETYRLDPRKGFEAATVKQEILALFGGDVCYVDEIPNGYCSQWCCKHLPWFIVTTPRGRIKIGWRKSVIHLEWTDTNIKGDAAAIFPKEEAWPGYETTQYDKVIHAHGYDAAKKYIRRLMEAT
jgi:hypothetical protein